MSTPTPPQASGGLPPLTGNPTIDNFLLRFPAVTQARFVYRDLLEMREWWSLLLPVVAVVALWNYRRARQRVRYEQIGRRLFEELIAEERREKAAEAEREYNARYGGVG